MRIKLLAHFEGAVSWPVGSEQTVEDAEAIRLIEAGFAVPVASTPVETTAAKPVREKRVKG